MPSTMDYKIREETIDKMKAKYVPVVKELCLEHLQIFDKSRYIEQIAAEMSEILPDLDVRKIESAALCVSNAMNIRGFSFETDLSAFYGHEQQVATIG